MPIPLKEGTDISGLSTLLYLILLHDCKAANNILDLLKAANYVKDVPLGKACLVILLVFIV